MSELNIRVTHRTEIDGRAVERTIDIETIPSHAPLASVLDARPILPMAAQVRETSLAAGIRFTRVLADGQYLPTDSDRTDHVAVIDHTTGLMWSVESIGDLDGDPMSQSACEKVVGDLDTLGYSDWRLPTRTELVGVIDDTRHEPAIDPAFFPRVKPRWHWTSTACAWSSASAWFVDFYYGGVDLNPRNLNGFALAVRRVGQ